MTDVRHRQLSFDVVGCAMRVQAALGPGFPESIYHRAMVYELLKSKIPFESQKPVEVYYDGALCGEFKLDLLAEGKIILELKAADQIVDVHVAQVISYLKATGLDLGIILNFGQVSLQQKRVLL